MNVTHWVMVGTVVLGAVLGIFIRSWYKRTARIEALELAVFGVDGVQKNFAKYVTETEFRREVGRLQTSIQGISEEGQSREDRILQAIENQTTVVGSEMRELKQDMRDQVGELREDLRSQASRIDVIMRRGDPR